MPSRNELSKAGRFDRRPADTARQGRRSSTALCVLLLLVLGCDSVTNPIEVGPRQRGGGSLQGSLDAVFWRDGRQGKVALHYRGVPFRLGTAISQIYTNPRSALGKLIAGGGWGPCPPDASTRYGCLIAPAFNLRYDQGSVGSLLLIQ